MQVNPANSNKEMHFSRLHWACRRGMLELDLLLGHFLHEKYNQLSQADQILFEELLSCTDPELFEWLLGSQTPFDKKFISLIETIRHHARSRV